MLSKLWPLVVILFVAVAVSPNVSAQTPPALWENITPNFGVAGAYANDVAVDPAHPGTVYLGTSGDNFHGEGIWKSTNYGSTFSRVDLPFQGPCGLRQFDGLNWALAVDDIGYVFTTNGYGCAQGIFRSTDGGFNWTNVLVGVQGIPSGDIGHIAIDPYLPGHMLASFHSDHSCECGGPDIESFDRGNTWIVRSRVPNTGHNNWVHFLNNSTTWAQGAPGGTFRTTDGNSWTQVNTAEPQHAGQEILKVGSTYYLGTDAGILRSTNDGVSWTLIPDNSPDGVVAVGTDGAGRLFTRTANAGSATTGPLPMLVSTDSGNTWAAYNAQTFTNGPKTFSRDSQYLYASMMLGGVWRLPLTGSPPPTPTNTPVAPTPTSVPATPTSTPLIPPTPTVTPIGPTRLCTLRWGSNTIKDLGMKTQTECAAALR